MIFVSIPLRCSTKYIIQISLLKYYRQYKNFYWLQTERTTEIVMRELYLVITSSLWNVLACVQICEEYMARDGPPTTVVNSIGSIPCIAAETFNMPASCQRWVWERRSTHY